MPTKAGLRYERKYILSKQFLRFRNLYRSSAISGTRNSCSATLKTNNNLRYERKYILSNPFLSNIESCLLTHPAGFHKNYPKRQVNSLYFDSPSLKNYQASLNGDYQRVKPRLRWYGPDTRSITNGQLELKIKTGELGYKKIFPLKNSKLPLNGPFPKTLKNLIPTLLTSYTRQYFISANKKVRLTIDQNINYTSFLDQTNNTATNPNTIIEIKYPKEAENHAFSVPQFLPLTLSQISKYSTGISLVTSIL